MNYLLSSVRQGEESKKMELRLARETSQGAFWRNLSQAWYPSRLAVMKHLLCALLSFIPALSRRLCAMLSLVPGITFSFGT